jgi:hypothetical protein
MAIDRRYQNDAKKVKLHSSFLAGKRSTARASGDCGDDASGLAEDMRS